VTTRQLHNATNFPANFGASPHLDLIIFCGPPKIDECSSEDILSELEFTRPLFRLDAALQLRHRDDHSVVFTYDVRDPHWDITKKRIQEDLPARGSCILCLPQLISMAQNPESFLEVFDLLEQQWKNFNFSQVHLAILTQSHLDKLEIFNVLKGRDWISTIQPLGETILGDRNIYAKFEDIKNIAIDLIVTDAIAQGFVLNIPRLYETCTKYIDDLRPSALDMEKTPPIECATLIKSRVLISLGLLDSASSNRKYNV
jgi:hypothetical protein